MNRTPLHSALVHLPIGSWIAALVLDLTFMANHNPLVAAGSFSCILIGVIGALLAAPFGLRDYLDIDSSSNAKKLATIHFVLNVVVITLYTINLLSRFDQNYGFPNTVTGEELALNIFSVLVLAVSGYVGGLLVFKFAVGVQSQEQAEKDAPFKRAA